MTTPRQEYVDDVTAVNKSERIPRNGHRMVAALSTTKVVRNLSIEPHLLDAALEKLATLVPTAEV